MGIEEMIEIEEQADEFMQKPPEQREKLLYIAVLRSDRRIATIEKDGCSRACAPSMIAKWTPATVGTFVMGLVYGAVEYFKAKQ